MSTIDTTLAERGSRYGEFMSHAVIAQSLQDVMRGTDAITTNWHGLSPDMQQALAVIADKIARILNGDPTYVDNWHDIQGYARLVEERLAKEAPTQPMTPPVATTPPTPEHKSWADGPRTRVCSKCGYERTPIGLRYCDSCNMALS